MGYTTYFSGTLVFDKPLTTEEIKYINDFSGTRRMKRDVNKLIKLYEGQYGLLGSSNYGKEGEFFVRADGDYGQSRDGSIIEYNAPASTQPGLWCQWHINKDGELEWNGAEKFYEYTEWLKYLINSFFEVWGYKLNGEITWEGEDSDDFGKILVTDNEVIEKQGKKVYE
jgi:hypothetical protein